MISSETLDKAVKSGVISAHQRDRLFAIERADPDSAIDREENLRLIGGGNDLFVTVGVLLLTAGFYFVLTTLFGDQTITIAGVMAAFSWIVAEVVTRQHRMKLSSTVLALIFMSAVIAMLISYARQMLPEQIPESLIQAMLLRGPVAQAGYILFGGTIAAAIVYFLRFRVPVLAGVIAIAATLLAFQQTALFLYDSVGSGAVLPPSMEDLPNALRSALYMPLLCGLIVFGVGVALDLHDRERRTVWSDCAFWLHVVSAPMLVHPLFILATGQDVAFGHILPDNSATIMLAILILAFVYVALAIDRRSLLAPTLAYFGSLGVFYLVRSTANTTGIPPFALILLCIGSLVIFFGAGWKRIRKLVIGSTLPRSVLSRLPPIKA